MNVNFKVLSLGFIVCGTLVKVFSLFWIYAIVSCVAIVALTIASVILSTTTDDSLKKVLRNPLDQHHKVKLGLDCK